MQKKHGEMLSSVMYYSLVGAAFALPLLRRSKRQDVRLLRTAETLAMATLLEQGLKHSIHAKRPDGSDNNSFPSSHVLNTMAVATVAGTFARKQAPFWYGGVALVAASRLLLQRHHERDVIAGVAFGYALARLELQHKGGYVLPRLSQRVAASVRKRP